MACIQKDRTPRSHAHLKSICLKRMFIPTHPHACTPEEGADTTSAHPLCAPPPELSLCTTNCTTNFVTSARMLELHECLNLSPREPSHESCVLVTIDVYSHVHLVAQFLVVQDHQTLNNEHPLPEATYPVSKMYRRSHPRV